MTRRRLMGMFAAIMVIFVVMALVVFLRPYCIAKYRGVTEVYVVVLPGAYLVAAPLDGAWLLADRSRATRCTAPSGGKG